MPITKYSRSQVQPTETWLEFYSPGGHESSIGGDYFEFGLRASDSADWSAWDQFQLTTLV